MLNKTKALGLAFIAVVAMSALMASTASAGKLDFAKEKVTITGTTTATDTTVFKLPLTVGEPLQTQCATQSLEATVGTGLSAEEVTATGTYTSCLTNGLNTVVRMNGCKYTVTGAGQPAGTANVDVAGCTEGKQIEIEITPTKCVISIPAQAVTGHVVFTQQGNDATMAITTEKIKNKQGPVGCPNLNCEQQSATFTGSTTIRAFGDTGLAAKKLLHGHEYQASTHDSVEVKITVT